MGAGRIVRFVLIGGLTLLPAAALAQSAATGAIAGEVKDATGAVLPGVTVEAASPALIEKVRTVVTDDRGQYKIIDLRPGPYTVTFTLPGFSSVRREGLELTTGFTATVNAELRVGGIEETVTVTGASPVVDVQNVRQQNLLSREVIDALPQAKTSLAYATLTPGVKTSMAGGNQQDVGGSFAEQPVSFAVNGGRSVDAAFYIDGMRQNLGGSNLRLYFESSANIQEVTIETSGISAESPSGGVQMNFVPKEGGNIFKAFANAQYSNQAMQGNNFTDELRARGLNSGQQQANIYDYGGGLGGPLKRDRLWFFTGHRWWGSKEILPGNFWNKTQGTLFYTPDLSRPAFKDAFFEDHTLRLTWQAAQKHKIGLSHGRQDNCQCFFGLALNVAPEAASNLRYKLTHVSQASWTYPATNRLLFQAGVTYGRFDPQSPRVGYKRGTELPKAIPITEASTGYRYGSATSYRGAFGPTYMDQVNGRVTGSHVTGSHAFKTGIYWFFGKDDNTTGGIPDPPVSYTLRGTGSVSTGFVNQVPIAVTYFASPSLDTKRSLDVGIYAQDQWTVKRLTLNLGLRFDRLHAWAPAMTKPATYFTPDIRFEKLDNVPNWKDLSPRFGAAYDLFGSGKTAVKVSLGRYAEYMSSSIANQASPANAIVTSATRAWNDVNRDFIPQENELGPLSNAAFGTVVINRRFSDDVLLGWGVRGYSWQTSASVQHELRPGVSVNVGYFRTSYGNFRATDNLRVTNADFDPYCITAPVDPRLPGGGGQKICGLYDLKPTAFGAASDLITRASHYGKQSEGYNGFEASVNARFGRGGSLSGGVNGGRTVTDNCEVLVDSPDKRFCRKVNPFVGDTQVKFSGVYPVPWDLQVSAVYQNLPGIPIRANYVATNAEIAPLLGRNLGACGTRPVCTVNVTITDLFDPFLLREDRLNQLDARLTKILRLGRTRVQVMFDLYNLFNANDILIHNTTYGKDWLRPSNIMGARIAKLGAQVDF